MNSLCPFCSIASTLHIHESQFCFSAYDIAPILPGHCLVITKDHYASFFDAPENVVADLFLHGRKLAQRLSHTFDTDAFDFALQEKEIAGQSIPHVHLHVIPRTVGDFVDPGDWYYALEHKNNPLIDSSLRPKLTHSQLLHISQRLSF